MNIDSHMNNSYDDHKDDSDMTDHENMNPISVTMENHLMSLETLHKMVEVWELF